MLPCLWPAHGLRARKSWRPFCSERCRTLDLGAWASEQYRIEADADPDPGEDGAPPPSA
ncbi:MAG: DNA gyrase inhibitor YacG [Burkholderiaceae bacterium]